jgi:hypothetical protein
MKSIDNSKFPENYDKVKKPNSEELAIKIHYKLNCDD